MITIFDIVFLIFFGFLLVCALIQARRGGIRSFISLVIVTASALTAFFMAQPIANMLVTLDISGMGMTYSGMGIDYTALGIAGMTDTVTSVSELINTFIMSTPEVAQIVSASPNIQLLVTQIPTAVMAQVLFVLIFLLLKPVSLLIYGIAKCFVPKYEKELTMDANGRMRRKKLKKHWLPGFAFCLARSIVCISVLMVPVSGVFGLLDKAATAFDVPAASENGGVEPAAAEPAAPDAPEGAPANSFAEIATTLKGIASQYTGGVVHPVLNAVQLDGLYTSVFHKLSEVTLDNGQTKVSLTKEIEKIFPLMGDVSKLASFGQGSMTSKDLSTFASAIRNLSNSDIVASVASDFLTDGAEKLAAGEEFFGMTLAGLDPQAQETVLDLLQTFATSDTASIKQDLLVLANCFDVIAKYGIVEALIPEDGEEIDIGAVLDAVTKKIEADGEDSAFVQELFEKLAESERFSGVIPAAMNYALYMASDMMGIPYDRETMYDDMMTGVTAALNNNNVSSLDMAKVEEEIEKNLVPAGDVAYLPMSPELVLLSTESASDTHYGNFIAMMTDIVKVLDKAGMKYDGSGITYTNALGTKHYRYHADTGLWSQFVPDASSNEKTSEIAEFAVILIKEAKRTATEAADGKLSSDHVKAISSIVAAEVGTDSGIGKIAGAFESTDKLVENSKNTVFFKENIKLNTAEFNKADTVTFASATHNLLSVAKEVVAIIPEDNGEFDIASVSELVKNGALETLGGVLDQLDNMNATPDNFASSFLSGAVNMLGDAEEVKPVKDALNGIVDGMKDGEELKFGEVLGGVSSIVATVADLTSYAENVQKFLRGEIAVAPDRAFAEHELAEGLKSIVGMRPATLNLLVSSIVDMIESMTEESAGEYVVIIRELLNNISSYAPADKDTAISEDAVQIVALFHYISELSLSENEPQAHVLMSQIMNYIAASELLSHMSAQIIHDMATALQNGESYFEIPLAQKDMYTAAYLTDPANATMGDLYVAQLFRVMMKADEEGKSTLTKDDLRFGAMVFLLFTDADGDSNDFEVSGLSLADIINHSKSNEAMQDDIAELHDILKDSSYSKLVEIYG